MLFSAPLPIATSPPTLTPRWPQLLRRRFVAFQTNELACEHILTLTYLRLRFWAGWWATWRRRPASSGLCMSICRRWPRGSSSVRWIISSVTLARLEAPMAGQYTTAIGIADSETGQSVYFPVFLLVWQQLTAAHTDGFLLCDNHFHQKWFGIVFTTPSV